MPANKKFIDSDTHYTIKYNLILISLILTRKPAIEITALELQNQSVARGERYQWGNSWGGMLYGGMYVLDFKKFRIIV